MENHRFLMGKSTISMAIFNGYDLQAPRHRSGIFRFPGARAFFRGTMVGYAWLLHGMVFGMVKMVT